MCELRADGECFFYGLKTDGKFLPSCSKIWKSSRPRCSALLLLYFTLVVRRLEEKVRLLQLFFALWGFFFFLFPYWLLMCCEILTRTHTRTHGFHTKGESSDEKEPKPKKTETRKRMCPCMGGFGSPQPALPDESPTTLDIFLLA